MSGFEICIQNVYLKKKQQQQISRETKLQPNHFVENKWTQNRDEINQRNKIIERIKRWKQKRKEKLKTNNAT